MSDQVFRIEDLEVCEVKLSDLGINDGNHDFISLESNGVVAILIPNKGSSAKKLAQKILDFFRSGAVLLRPPPLSSDYIQKRRLHKLGCDEYHAHQSPGCCRSDCWCRTTTYSLESLVGKTCRCGAFIKVVSGVNKEWTQQSVTTIMRAMLYCAGCEKQIDECKCEKVLYQESCPLEDSKVCEDTRDVRKNRDFAKNYDSSVPVVLTPEEVADVRGKLTNWIAEMGSLLNDPSRLQEENALRRKFGIPELDDHHGPYCSVRRDEIEDGRLKTVDSMQQCIESQSIVYCGLLRDHEGSHSWTRAF